MALFGGYKKKATLSAAIKQTANARENEGAKADQLFISAYQGFADIVKGDLVQGEALFNWGFALLHQAKTRKEEEGFKLYLDAISKFNFCLLVEPNHLGAAIDGGVAYMDLARIMSVDASDELYELAKEFFDNAERIQRGSAAYNLACISAIQGDEKGCLETLEFSKEFGSLPRIEDMQNDVDLAKIKDTAWFADFIGKISTPEPEVVDKTVPVYDAEGNVTNNRKEKKELEYEVDGVFFDVEGNVVRTTGDEGSEGNTKAKVVVTTSAETGTSASTVDSTGSSSD